MERLGEDEIFSIFGRNPNLEDKKSFSKVCKKFLKAASFHLWSLRTKFPYFLYDMLIASPKMVSFKCRKPLSNNHMKLIAESCPNIIYLDLSLRQYLDHEVGNLEFHDVGLCAIMEACNHLVYVNLGGRLRFKDIGIGSLVRSCKNLIELTLVKCINVAEKSLKMIGEASSLENLYLQDCYSISDLGLEYLANGDLKFCLRTLWLCRCDKITDNGIIYLKKLVGLRSLDLSICEAITDYGVVALCELPNLERLYLDFLTNITDISLLEIGRKCLKMLLLSLTGCNRITIVGLRSFSGHLRLAI